MQGAKKEGSVPMRALADLAATDLAAAGSPAGRAWLAALPPLLHDLARQWNLTADEDQLWHGDNAVVVPVRQHGQPLALKLAWPPGQASGEADALTAWRGRGIVELVAADVPRGALLLERLDASRSLADIPVTEAAAIAGALARTLAIEAPGSFPPLQAEARQLTTTLQARQRQLHDPVPAQWVTLAARLAADLAEDPARLLVHTDLHYDNVLASQRPGQPWVAIDPAAAAGAPERSVAELLWTRADELHDPQAITGLLGILIDSGQLDRAKATAWAFVRSIDYWLWGLQNGFTIDPVRCQRVASALAPLARHGSQP
jgi:streptomycin 6-kinase